MKLIFEENEQEQEQDGTGMNLYRNIAKRSFDHIAFSFTPQLHRFDRSTLMAFPPFFLTSTSSFFHGGTSCRMFGVLATPSGLVFQHRNAARA